MNGFDRSTIYLRSCPHVVIGVGTARYNIIHGAFSSEPDTGSLENALALRFSKYGASAAGNTAERSRVPSDRRSERRVGTRAGSI